MIDRRHLLTLASGTLVSGLAASKLNALQGFAGDAFLEAIRSVDQLSAAVRGETIDIASWREGLAVALESVDPADIREAIDFDMLARQAGYASEGVATAPIRLTIETGERLAFYPKFFAVGQGRAIIPHGHANMVSAHMTLSGRFHLRQYDRVAVESDALIIRPTIDRTVRPGELSTIGDPDDNVHWFVAEADSHTLDVIITSLDETAPDAFDIFNIDPDAAIPLGNDRWRAPRLGIPDALAKYG